MDAPAGVAAVDVRDCFKSYGTNHWWQRNDSKNTPVFNKLNLTVPRASMYALLGPSGCGKTTLIKCILGRLNVNGGTIEIFGQQLDRHYKATGADFGYMPQETSIFAILTIEETLQYYGQALGLTKSFIKRQTKFLVEFLKLPPKNMINNKLSGGELRRVSFAVATMHKPKLLILDEPTVGVDPVGRQRMWCYLRYMVKVCSSTVILSTHYIEEARRVDHVGLMQDGAMLEEGSPDFLIRKWNVLTMEELFFKVFSNRLGNDSNGDYYNGKNDLTGSECNVVEIGGTGNQSKDDYESEALTQKLKNLLNVTKNSKESDSLTVTCLMPLRIAAIVKKNIISLYRYPITLLFVFSLPAVNIFVSFMAMSSNISHLDVGVFNEDQGHLGKHLLLILNNDVITQTQCQSYEGCHQAVIDGKYHAFIGIKKNFSRHYNERYIYLNSLNQNALHDGFMNITIDKTHTIIAQTLSSQFTAAMQTLGKEVLHEAGLSSNLSNPFIKVNYQPKDLIGASPIFSIVPQGMLLINFDTQIATPLLLLFLEKKTSYLERSLVSGITLFEIVIGYVIVDFFLNLAQVGGTLLIVFGILKLPLLGSLPLTAILNVFSGLVGMSFGIFCAALTDKLMLIAPIVFTMIVSAPALIALFWPMQAATPYFQIICKCLPFYLPSEALIDVMYRNLGIFYPDVIIGISVLIAWIVILTSLTVVCIHMKSR